MSDEQKPVGVYDKVCLPGSDVIGVVQEIWRNVDFYGLSYKKVVVMDSKGFQTTFQGVFAENLVKSEVVKKVARKRLRKT